MGSIHSIRKALSSLFCIALLALGGGAAELAAQGAAGDEISEETVRSFRLTMDGVRAWFEATEAMTRVITENPALAERLAAEAGDLGPGAQVALFEAQPLLAEALGNAGLSPREFILTGMAFLQASFAVALLETDPSAELPPEVNAENLELVRANWAEIERLGREMQARQTGG